MISFSMPCRSSTLFVLPLYVFVKVYMFSSSLIFQMLSSPDWVLRVYIFSKSSKHGSAGLPVQSSVLELRVHMPGASLASLNVQVDSRPCVVHMSHSCIPGLLIQLAFLTLLVMFCLLNYLNSQRIF